MRRRNRQNPLSLVSFQDIVTGMCGIMIFMVLVQILGLVVYPEREEYTVGAGESDLETSTLRSEIRELEMRLEKIREKSRAIVSAAKDAARPEDADKYAEELSNMTEREKIIAALVSQIHDLETQIEKAKDADAKNKARVKEMERTRRLIEQQIAEMKSKKGVTLIPERGESKIPFYVICSSHGISIRRPLEKDAGDSEISLADINAGFAEFLSMLDHTTHAAVLLVRPTGVKAMDMAVLLLQQNSFTYGRDPLEEGVDVYFGKEGR